MVKFNALVIVKIINRANVIPNKLKCNDHAIGKFLCNTVKFGVGSGADSGSDNNIIMIPVIDMMISPFLFHVSLVVAENKIRQ